MNEPEVLAEYTALIEGLQEFVKELLGIRYTPL